MKANLAAVLGAGLLACLAFAPAQAGEAVIVGPNGGSGSVTVKCADGYYRDACAHSWNYTTAAGDNWSGAGATVVGPYRGHHIGTVTTPNGSIWHRNRVWRR